MHLWSTPLGGGSAVPDPNDLIEVLAGEDLARLADLGRTHRREQFIVGRALLRHVLSHYAPVTPQEWRFHLGHRGKPIVAGPSLTDSLWFNQSHSDGMSVIALVGRETDIGVDVERSSAVNDALTIADECFSHAEARALRALPAAARDEAFTHLWTLKESYVKAAETSLTDGLRSARFTGSRRGVRVTFDTPLQENPRHWRFELLQLDPSAVLALAVRAPGTGHLRISTGTWPATAQATIAPR